MRLAELRGPRDFQVVEVPVPEPGRDELLVRVEACGVCASELSQWTGKAGTSYPARIGHEVSGTVAAVGDEVTSFAVGDPVAVWTTGGGYADYVAVPEEDSRRRPADLPAASALLEPVACASNAVELADVRLGDTVLVVGAGFMGLIVTQLAALRGATEIVVADSRADVLALASSCGATRTVDVADEALTAVVHELTGGRGADVTFEVTGTQSALEVVGDVTRMSGKVVLVGYHQGEPRRVPLGHWNWMAFSILNAHFRDVAVIMRGMTVGLRLLSSGQLRLGPLVTHRYALEDISVAFEEAVSKPQGFVKAVVDLGATRST
jgi:L-iditol 2-dehydrogenase